jgi:D-alanyl-D-alanine carboxypeptidase
VAPGVPSVVIMRLLVGVLLALALGGPAPAVAATTPPGCGDHAGTVAALRSLTGGYGVAGAAIETRDRHCGRWSAASGVADRVTLRPMPVTERIRIGSTTKTFTATVVLQLVAEHRIALDAPVARYLPGVVDHNGYDGRRITVRQLLQHTSGLPDHTDALNWDDIESLRYRRFTERELVDLALAMPHPETAWTYSTTNYVLAGMIVEKVTGHPIGEEITRRVIRPLRLRNTYWPGDAPRIRGPHPRGYLAGVDVTDFSMSVGGAGGALVSTLDDEDAFFRALLGGRLLPPAQLAEMTRTVPADPDRVWPGARYGLGLISTPLPCGGVFWGHGGTTPGFRTFGGLTADGRGAQLVLNDEPMTDEAYQAFLSTVPTALCGEGS